ncbi:hypothetical protein [Methanocella sp. MCL-LM]|uniref:hypothetical protein n=1 Tax=Methanocella sp. MCL-LM TaxID=3412035 RepID=UPI003C70D6EB
MPQHLSRILRARRLLDQDLLRHQLASEIHLASSCRCRRTDMMKIPARRLTMKRILV